ncbi:caldesmon-like [Corticium candelabrum]|uniref:caldesmon-like n=1 Tax=Corticium candelabrum TaxID=121492 RepID=UPI002E264699|nr:caldesmon-like [Corticium candelabrum]
MGLTGAELRQFVTDQQTIEREERQKERELKKEEQEAAGKARIETAEEAERARKEKAEEAEREMIAAERERHHALEIKRLELEAARIKDALIRAPDVYSRLSEEAAVDYRQLKEALLKRYDLAEDGYRHKFRKSRQELAERPDQFIHRLKNYLKKWMMFSKCDPKSAEEDLAVHLKEREIASLEDLANAADRYLTAHQRKFCTVSNAPTSQPTTISDGTNTASIGERA